jgi:hypothetical protein
MAGPSVNENIALRICRDTTDFAQVSVIGEGEWIRNRIERNVRDILSSGWDCGKESRRQQ